MHPRVSPRTINESTMCENFWGCELSVQVCVAAACRRLSGRTQKKKRVIGLLCLAWREDQRRCFLHFLWHAPRPIFSASLSSQGLGRRSRDPSPGRGAHGAQCGDVRRRCQRARLAESAWQSMLFLCGQLAPRGCSSRACSESGRR